MKTIKGYKAYDKDLKCRDFQYEIGKIYEQTGKPSICNSGFHFCENPMDVLNYYNIAECKFTEVESLGNINKEKDSKDTKIATDKIKIGAELDLSAFIKASFNFLLEKTSKSKKVSGYSSKVATSGNYSQVATSGDYSQVATSGYSSKVATSGDSSQVATSGYSCNVEIKGEKSVGANIGINGIIKGKIGTWITLAEYNSNYECICVKSEKIDGKKIKEDVWYKLENGKFVKYDN